MIKAVLPGAARRDGAIVNISSIGARISPPGSGTTRRPRPLWRRCRHRCGRSWKPLGITVTVVEPGGFRTDFAGRSLQQSRDAIADYATRPGADVRSTTPPTAPSRAIRHGRRRRSLLPSRPQTRRSCCCSVRTRLRFRAVIDAQDNELEEWQELAEHWLLHLMQAPHSSVSCLDRLNKVQPRRLTAGYGWQQRQSVV